ncbi:MAG TPA: hypothetical protein ENN94_05555 [Geoalkalibacter subterraneus]|uniref:Flagellar assembly protein FliH n=1 Tax=Geoalkalibacter subterraneus TaxID=483547 RepID=A0A831PNV2_9BACT|nr:hypothetical protein [Geoalkalibacter subterraneus]
MAVRAPVVESPRGEDSGGETAAQGISEEQLAEAYQRGREEALAEAGANLVSAADALGEALREISRLREGTLRRSTEDMVRLVMVIAEQVIGAEIATRPEFVLETLKQAMHHALKTDEYQVRVHPDDLAVVTDNKPLFMAAVSGLKNIRLETDPAITRGGCVVESQLGQVDATLDSRLDEIRRSLLAHLEES